MPSSMALATLVVFAQGRRGFLIMLSSICVAVMTGLPICVRSAAQQACDAFAHQQTTRSTPMLVMLDDPMDRMSCAPNPTPNPK